MASNITFHLLPIWLQTLVAIDSESRLTSFPSFCVPPSEVAELFYSNLSRCPSLSLVVQVVGLELTACTVAQDWILNMWFCSYVIALHRDK